MKSGMAAGSEASARVTELSRISRKRHILQETECGQATAPDAELAAKMEGNDEAEAAQRLKKTNWPRRQLRQMRREAEEECAAYKKKKSS